MNQVLMNNEVLELEEHFKVEDSFEPGMDEESLDATNEDDVDVCSEGDAASSEAGEFEEASFGSEGFNSDKQISSGVENVLGFDQSMLKVSRESLAQELGEEKLLDAWYADLGDPTIGALLQQSGVSETTEGVRTSLYSLLMVQQGCVRQTHPSVTTITL